MAEYSLSKTCQWLKNNPAASMAVASRTFKLPQSTRYS